MPGRIVGSAPLVIDTPPNQPHRADVAKMMVDPRFRRHGIAKQLLGAVERRAIDEGRTLLVLDTETNGAAERLYRGCGWIEVGVIPNYALKPHGGLASTTYFYKPLAP
jgi:ribosomal protein S18 acetylase RimI-like enzyme